MIRPNLKLLLVAMAILLAAPATAAASPYSTAVLNDSPAGYWRLGEASGTTAADSSGNAYNGSYVNAPSLGVPGAVSEDPNTAVAFNGTNQYSAVPYNAALNPVAPFTVEAWAKPTGGAGTVREVVASRSSNPARGYKLSIATTGEWRFFVGTGAASAVSVTGSVATLNGWTHLVGEVEPVGTDLRVRLYVNSVLSAQQTFSMTSFSPNTTRPLRIGADSSSTVASFFPGAIDEVAVYNSLLSPTRIRTHYEKAAIFTVNTTSDTVDAAFDATCADAGGNCSLRAAVMEADFLGSPVTIKLPAGTYTLTRGPADDDSSCQGGAEVTVGDLDLYAPVTITGAGAGSTIVEMGTLSPSGTVCGGAATGDRIFDVDNNGSGGGSFDGLDINISGMTLRNGRAPAVGTSTRENGGAIRYSGLHFDSANRKGTLTLSDCVITGNTAAGNGGGVYSVDGIVSITNCTFADNTAGQGSGGGLAFDGGIFASNPPAALAQITGSTFSGNHAARGSGTSTIGRGGAISLTQSPGAGFIRNTTLSGNRSDDAGGGLLLASSSIITLTNATVTKNRADADGANGGVGGGIDVASGTPTLENTIVAGNLTGTGTTASDIAGNAAASSSFNLIGTGGSGGLTNGTNNNQVGVANAGLGVLGDNGGPTQTHALLAGSPAFDAGSDALASAAGLTTDQRGVPFDRLRDGPDADTTATVDVGALEQHPSLSNLPDKTTVTNTPVSVPFDVGDATAGFDSIDATSSNTTLVPNGNLTISGTGGSRTLDVTPAADQFGTTTITVTATSTVGGKTLSASDTFVLTVNSPPSASITSPTDGSIFATPTSIPISANASDNDGTVTQVEFFHDGILISTDTSAPYSATYSGATVGTHSLTARATDNLGATTTSSAVSITVHDPPSVSITAPTNGSIFVSTATVNITADANDDGSVTQVEFFHDGTPISTDTTAPYSASYATPTAGTHSLTARATDNNGAQTTSSPVSITVHNPPTVSLTAPASGSIYLNSNAIPMSATASDDGSVTQVEFFHDGVLISTDTTAPYAASYTSPAVGVHTLTARATDNNGAQTTSAARSIIRYATATSYVNAVLADNPVGYWRLDENKGTIVFDRKGNGNTGTFFKAPTLNATGALTSDTDKAVTFNGTTQYAQIPFTSALNPVPPFSVEVWAKPTGGAGIARTVLMSRDISPTRGYYFLANAADKWQVWLGDGATGWRTLTGPAITLNVFTHLVATVVPAGGTNVTVTLYVNGAQAAQQTFASTAQNTVRPLRFAAGRTESTPTAYFPGTLDEIAIYNTALSATRVSAHYTTGHP